MGKSVKYKILVTGGAGFIGSHVADILLEKGHEVVILDDLSAGFKRNINRKADFAEGSITDVGLVEDIMKGVDIVYHFAAFAAERLSHYIKRFNYEINLTGSINLINAAINNDVKKFLFLSSMAVYGTNQTPMSEKLPRKPEDSYAIAKSAVENELEISKTLFDMDYVIIRAHNVYGERQNIRDRYRNVIGIFINQIMRGLPPVIHGDGEQTRAFSYIRDVAPYIADAPFIEKAGSEIINLGTGECCTVNRLAEIVQGAMDSVLTPVHSPENHEVRHAFCTTEKSERILGYRSRFSLEEGIGRMAGWAKELGPQKQESFDILEINKVLPDYWKQPERQFFSANE